GTMVAGWRIFGLAGKASDDGRTEARPASAPARPAALAPAPAASSPAAATARSIAISGVPASAPANDARPGGIRRQIPLHSRGILILPFTRARGRQPLPRHACPLYGEIPMIRAIAPLALGLTLAAQPAFAGDQRLVERVYDPAQVVRIEGRTNVQATIVFGES